MNPDVSEHLCCPGTYAFTLTVSDGQETDTDEVVITVEDTTPPVITLNGDNPMTLEACVDDYSEPGATANDNCDPNPTLSVSGDVDDEVPGDYIITYTAEDESGNTSTAERTVQVRDTTPPEIVVDLQTDTLWPPNHKMVLVAVISASDVCGEANGTLALSIEVTSNQDLNGPGDGNTDADWEVVDLGDGTYAVWLRSERTGTVDEDRVYTITATATDDYNTTTAEATATVPHDMGKGNQAMEKTKKGAKKPVVITKQVGTTGTIETYFIDTGSRFLGVYDETPMAPWALGSSGQLTFGLAQNFPNPFNPSTTIRFSLEEASHVRLAVYNVAGQEIRTLMDASCGQGSHSVVWDGRDAHGRSVTSGVYLYRLAAGERVAIRKMVLAK
jgi:hypothetical protein